MGRCTSINRLLCFVFLQWACSGAFALDGDRKGFSLGLGMGAHGSTLNSSSNKSGTDSFEFKASEKKAFTGLSSDFKLGYGLTSDLEVHLFNKATWSVLNTSDNDYVFTLSGAYGVSATLFVPFGKPQLWPSAPFVSAGYGFSFFSVPSRQWLSPFEGRASFVGLGYEFERHKRLQLDVMWGSSRDTESSQLIEKDFLSFILSLSIVAY